MTAEADESQGYTPSEHTPRRCYMRSCGLVGSFRPKTWPLPASEKHVFHEITLAAEQCFPLNQIGPVNGAIPNLLGKKILVVYQTL